MRTSQRKGRARRPWHLGVLMLVTLLACAGHRPPAEVSGEALPAWPPPPAQPRVVYEGSFQVPPDLGIRKNALARFFSRLARGRPRWALVRPFAVTVTGDGKIAVADPDARSVHLYDPERRRYERLDEAGGQPLVSPVGVAAAPDGGLFVSDSGLGAVHRYDSRGKWIAISVAPGELERPTGLAFDTERQVLYVVDTLGHRVVAFDARGRRLAVIGSRGTGPGEFNFPVAVTVGAGGRLYVCDAMNFRVQILEPSGRFVREFGKAGSTPGSLDKSKGIGVDGDGHVYVVDALHDVIQVFDGTGRLLTVVGGTGTRAGEFWLPAGIHVGRSGRILVADSANRRVQILRYLGDRAEG